MASGPSAAAAAVKNRMTPAAAPCWLLGKQLMPFELSVGYMIDMHRPDMGSNQAPVSTPPINDPRKHRKIARLNTTRAVVHESRPRSHAPRKRPSARNTKKMVSAYPGSQPNEPAYSCR